MSSGTEVIERFSDVRKELENVEELHGHIDDFERNSIFHSTVFLKKAKDQSAAMRVKMLNSQIREKNEITERLHELAHNLGMLRTLVFVKDEKAFSRIKDSFLTNEYSSIPVIAEELNDFRDKLDNLKKGYKAMINDRHASIDFKVKHEHHLDSHLKKLENVRKKQKALLVSMGLMFTKLSKELIRQKRD